MKLSEIAEFVWNNRQTIDFGSTETWSDNTFLHPWFKEHYPKQWRTGSDRPGWYWFSLNDDFDTLKNTVTPATLPTKACDFGEQSSNNIELFNNELTHKKSKLAIVYNGHESDVLSRIRSHFFLNNNSTGALGINSYPEFSSKQWSVNIFLRQHLEGLNHIDQRTKDIITKYCNSKTGRVAIEQAWRSKYGWPILCKA